MGRYGVAYECAKIGGILPQRVARYPQSEELGTGVKIGVMASLGDIQR
jgi:hypothetical protein